jgi:phospholipase/carboxylesterase
MNELKTMQVQDWVLRYRAPAGEGSSKVIVLLHGWTGDEDSMWVFASRLPEDHLLIAPRGIYPAPGEGYAWHPQASKKTWPWVADFRSAVDMLLELFNLWPNTPAADFSKIRLAGFSQGAALAYTFALLYPGRLLSLAGLAGFLPDGASVHIQNRPLEGLPVYVSHGIKDQLVPVARARQGVQLLKHAGAIVTYCESDVGHKLSAGCFNGMEVFFNTEDRIEE